MSWRALLDALRTSLEQHGEDDALSDLRQLDGLVTYNEREAFHPLAPADLTSELPRRVRDYLGVVDDLTSFLLNQRDRNDEKIADKSGLRKASGPG